MSSMYGRTGSAGMGTGGMGTGNRVPKGYESGQLNNYSPEQWKVFQQFASLLGPEGFLSKIAGGDQSAFEQMEAPALRQFSGLQGNIASRFSGMGSGARHSSGFQNTMNAASSDFAQQLQGRRLGLQNEAIQGLGQLSSNFLSQRPYENFLTEKKPSFIESLLGSLGNLGGQTAGMGGNLGILKLLGLI